MATFAVMAEGIVTNVVLADSLADAEAGTNATCVEYTESNPAGIGWKYDGVNFIAPIIEPVVELITE